MNARRFPEMEAVRDLCRRFPDEIFARIRRAPRLPEEFVDALTKAGGSRR